MAKQNINIGSSANDGSGDSLRDAAVKINSNFTELYNISGLDTSFTQGAFNKANSSTVLAQSSFNKANSSTVLAQAAFNQANNGVYTSNTLINGSHTVKLNDGGLLEIDQGYGFIGPLFGPGAVMFSDVSGQINNVPSYFSVIGSFSANSSYNLGYIGTFTGMGNNVTASVTTYNDETQSTLSWDFGADGLLQLPNGGTITDNTFGTIINTDKTYLQSASNTQIQTNAQSNTHTKTWNFDTFGTITFPDNKKQITAYDGKLTLPEDGFIVDSHGISVIVHPYVLDIEIDGGTTNSVYSKNDMVFDGGSTSTVFTFGQAVIDGCSAFSHSISKNFDGGSAVTI